MELERSVSSGGGSWLSGAGVAAARRVLMPWTCRKDRPSAVERRDGAAGGGSGALMRHRHRVHPTDADAARRVSVRGRRVWKNLFPVNGRSIHELRLDVDLVVEDVLPQAQRLLASFSHYYCST